MEELVKKSKEGDIHAYTKLIQGLEKDLYRIAKTRSISEDDICDAIQNTMLISFKNIKKLKEDKYFKTWIIKILLNECNKIHKKNIKEKNVVEKTIAKVYNNTNEINNQEYNNFLDFHNMINKLKDDEQLIFTLFYKDKYSCKEIAKIMNIKEGTVKSKLDRGREKIKNNLEEEFKWMKKN